MGLSEADSGAKLIDPALHTLERTEDLFSQEETASVIEIIKGKSRKQAKGRIDYTLRGRVNPHTQPIAVAIIEAKAEDLTQTYGLEQAKFYCERLNVLFVFSTTNTEGKPPAVTSGMLLSVRCRRSLLA